jgi:hypothetical protein
MDDTLAHKRLSEVLDLIDRYEDMYDRRWGYIGNGRDESLDRQLNELEDEVRGQVRFAREIVARMGEGGELAPQIDEHSELVGHWFKQARKAIIQAISILANREELARITGPVGPRLQASELHPAIWGAAATLWDNGHFRQAVQTAASALEGLVQAIAGPGVSGENLAILFSLSDPTAGSPRLRIRNVDPSSRTWKSAHDGAAALVRGAFLGVRNLTSHPGWPEPNASEAPEMLAVLSYVAHRIDRCDIAKAK